MRSSAGQSLLELALCVPVVMLLALGTVGLVQIADARSGLDAATQAAASTAARASDPVSANAAAQSRFSSVIAGYPIRAATLVLSMGSFSRASPVIATSTGFVDIGWTMPFVLPGHVPLAAKAVVRLEWWRTHRGSG